MTNPLPDPVRQLIDKARAATSTLRDFARENGMVHFQRDPLVVAIHRALDAYEAALTAPVLPRQPYEDSDAEWLRGMADKLERTPVDRSTERRGGLTVYGFTARRLREIATLLTAPVLLHDQPAQHEAEATRVDTPATTIAGATAGPNEMARAFRAGWATGYQDSAEGGAITWLPGSERPVEETEALERWLRGEAARRERSAAREQVQPPADRPPVESGKGELVKTVEIRNVLVDGYDAAFWRDSYTIVRDAVIEHLGEFVHEDDVAEEAIIVAAIEAAGKKLPPPSQGEPTP